MSSSRADGYIGLGPMVIPEEFLVANQREAVDTIVGRVTSACKSLLNPDSRLPRKFYPNHVISIIGGRGTGKTSVLMTALERILEKKEALVVNIIRPDSMEKNFPIVAAIVYAIERHPDVAAAISEDETLIFRHPSWALSVDETYRVVARDSVNTSEWASRIFDLLASADVVAGFQEWVDRILSVTKRKMLVVPIDDADVAIDKAEDVINTLRTYLASSKIVSILAVDIDAFERRIRNSRLSKLPNVPGYPHEPEERKDNHVSPWKTIEPEAQQEQKYVENLMAKVLPPAARCHLADMSKDEKLNRRFFLSGRDDKSLVETFDEADKATQESHSVHFAPLAKAHPEILSSNVRFFANQLLMVKDVCVQYLDRMSTISEQEKATLIQKYRATELLLMDEETGELSGLGIPPASSADELLRDRFQMDIVRVFLSTGGLDPLARHIRINYGVELERLDTMSQLVRFILRVVNVGGAFNNRLQYRIAGKTFSSDEINGIVGLCVDWAIAKGVSVEKLMRVINYPYRIYTYSAIPIPRRLAGLLSGRTSISSFEPNARLVEGSFKIEDRPTYAGPQIVVPVDQDRVAPVFIEDSNAMGRYAHGAVSYGRMQDFRGNALDFVEKLDEAKAKDVRVMDLRNAFYRVLGLLSLQTAYILNTLVTELVFDGDAERSAIESEIWFHGSMSVSWAIVEMRGVLEELTKIFSRRSLSLYKKIFALSFIADLPLRTLLACMQDGLEATKRRDALLESIVSLLDRLTRIGLISDRGKRFSAGRFDTTPTRKTSKVLKALNKNYRLLDWKRRWRAVNRLLRTLRNATFEDAWDSRSQPPQLWIKWADRAIEKSRSKSKKKQPTSVR